MNYILAFHIGPVQDFISTARRTQDWWMGSWLLSHLSKTAISKLPDYQQNLLLPKQLPQSDDPAIADTPNHFLASIPDDLPEQVARSLEGAVRDKWQVIHGEVRKKFFESVPSEVWTRQLETFLEIYWAIAPDNGKGSRSHAQAALDARKRLREFAQVEEPHLKCTLCGVRQELSGKPSVGEARDWWVDLVKAHLKKPHLEKLRIRENGNERLCAICAVKRAALAAKAVPLDKEDGHFPSTSSISASTFKKRLIKTGNAADKLAGHLQTLNDIGVPAKVNVDCLPELAVIPTRLPAGVRDALLMFDGDLFYLETFTEKRLRDDYPEADPSLAGFGADSLRTLFGAMRSDEPAMHIPPPSKYYGALMMDGDHMGRFFSKTKLQEAQAISERISQFAGIQARRIVEGHYGRLIYSGGDDALALLPLEGVLPCARELQDGFKNAVSEALKNVRLPAGVKAPTPSVGIVIAHHTQPFDATLATMRHAEQAAKNHYGRDAVCVHVLKRSGEEVRIGAHWKYGSVDAIELANRIVVAFRDETLSMKFAQSVADEARGLAGDELTSENRFPPEARAAALKRLARRHSRDDKKAEAEGLAVELAKWAEGKNDDDKRALGIEEIANWVLLARFIASGGRDE